MNVTVSQEILKETARCKHDFSCIRPLQHQTKPNCTVDYANGKNVLFLTAKNLNDCPYKVPFGFGLVCTCPTHFAIYKSKS